MECNNNIYYTINDMMIACGVRVFVMRVFMVLIAVMFFHNAFAIEAFNLKTLTEEDLSKSLIRIKDIVSVEGIRDNILMGYGLVVGLNGTGDDLKNSVFTQQELQNFLGRLGINARGSNLKTKNVAAVTIVATLPAFARQGNKLDINVSAIGDAKNLEGGVLLASPLLGADGEVYAVAQGMVSVSGIENKGKSNTIKSIKTSGFISNGAIIEREIDFELDSVDDLKLSLHNPDVSTAYRVARGINEEFGYELAEAIDPGTVMVSIPEEYRGRIMDMLFKMEDVKVRPDSSAKIIISESTGTVIIGQDVRIEDIAISQGNLSVEIMNKYGNKNIGEPGEDIIVMEKATSLKELVDALNRLGVTPRDLIDILYNIKRSGALQAEIVVR